MLVSKSSFEPRGTGSRRSTTPSHGNMRLRPSSTETWKRVLLVPPTKIMFLLFTELGYFRVLYASYYALIMLPVQFDLCSRKKKSKKKEELALERVKLPEVLLFPCDVVVDFFFHEEIQRRKRKEREKKGKKLARASQNSPVLEPPSSVLSRRLFIHLPFSLFLDKKKRLICASPREKANDEEKSSHPSTLYHR